VATCAQDLRFRDVAGAATPTFLLAPGTNVYGQIEEGQSMFDCDSLELWTPLSGKAGGPAGTNVQDLLLPVLGMYVNLCSRGAILNGRILKDHVKVIEGAINLFMPIGSRPCYRNR